jgi:biopolymer transport protein ExbD
MRFRRRLAPETNINLVPMIDVVFQLIIFFMVATTFVSMPGINVELPESTTAEHVVMEKLIVSIVSRNEIYLNETKYDIEGFRKALASMGDTNDGKSKNIVIEGNKDVSYALMVEVLDIARENGFRGVNLRTRVPEKRNR